MTYFDPLGKEYKSVTGAVKQNEKIKFRVKGDFDSVFFIFRKDGKDGETVLKMNEKNGVFEAETSFSEFGLYFYCFKTDRGYISLGDNYSGYISDEKKEFQTTVYREDYCTPDWLKGGVIYQIFPDRFNCSGTKIEIPKGKIFHEDKTEMPNFLPDCNGEVLNNDFFGGDLKGIERKIPYLKSLGVTAIYLNPIFKAYSNHRYDTGDYMEIDPLLGTEKDLKSLISACAKEEIGLILDGVFNHTGSDSRYFNKKGNYDSVGAYNDKNSAYFGWYKFTSFPSEYEAWWGVKTLPATNKECCDYVSFITGKDGVIDKYTSMGIKGWRLDVVDELPFRFVQKIRKAIKTADENAVVIGEVWEDASNKISYGVRREYFCGGELDGVMNYPLKNAIIDFLTGGDADKLSYIIKSLVDHYPKISLDITMNLLSTHDTPRILSVLSGRSAEGLSKSEMSGIILNADEYALAVERLKIASVLQFTLPGVPSVYYGDEAGMQGFFDPYNRAFFPWGNENTELNSHYGKLSAIRKENEVFKDGDFKEVFCGKRVYAFKRIKGENEVLIAVNAGETSCDLAFNGRIYDALNDESFFKTAELKPLSCRILINESR